MSESKKVMDDLVRDELLRQHILYERHLMRLQTLEREENRRNLIIAFVVFFVIVVPFLIPSLIKGNL